jgi:hypothetical protein
MSTVMKIVTVFIPVDSSALILLKSAWCNSAERYTLYAVITKTYKFFRLVTEVPHCDKYRRNSLRMWDLVSYSCITTVLKNYRKILNHNEWLTHAYYFIPVYLVYGDSQHGQLGHCEPEGPASHQAMQHITSALWVSAMHTLRLYHSSSSVNIITSLR